MANSKKEQKRVIWSNYNLNLEDWIYDIKECYPDVEDEYKLMEIMEDWNNGYLDDERSNLRKYVDEEIVVIADLGLWHGRRSGYRELHSRNIADCLCNAYDYAEWYVDKLGDLMCMTDHHDGTNFYTYRYWKSGLSNEQKENFLAKIYNGTVTRRDITRYTKRLGDKVAEVYGWDIR